MATAKYSYELRHFLRMTFREWEVIMYSDFFRLKIQNPENEAANALATALCPIKFILDFFTKSVLLFSFLRFGISLQ